jgi:hypothetical protein
MNAFRVVVARKCLFFRICIVTPAVLGFVGNSVAQSTNTPLPTPIRTIEVRAVSSIEQFRGLLAMDVAQRDRALAAEPAEKRQKLQAKIAEYEAMTPEERELRLRMTQLRLYLVPLMKTVSGDRDKLLSTFSAEDRVMFERRLKIWDEIPVQLQREFLENEANLGFFIKWKDTKAEERAKMLQTFPLERREQLQKELVKWSAMPAERQSELCGRFNEFFELDDKEKAKTLATLSERERRQMEKTLDSLENLPPEERKKCIDGFQAFLRMSPEERNQFLKNAERWQSMSTTERQAWRGVVRKMPPLPPGLPPLLPPLPPKVTVQK